MLTAQALHDMFVIGIPVLEKIGRTVIIYLFLIVGLRLAGKRELGQLNTLDLVVIFTLSNSVQNAIIGNDNSLVGGMLGAGTLLFTNYLTVRFLFKHQKLDQLIEGDPTVLIENGKLIEKNLEKEGITKEELSSVVHKQGIEKLDEVEKAILETGGSISVFAKQPSMDASRHQELMTRLDELSRQVAVLSNGQAR